MNLFISLACQRCRADEGRALWERTAIAPRHALPVSGAAGRDEMTTPIIVLLGNDSASLAALHALSATAGYRPLRCRPQEVTDAHAEVKCARADLVILDLWAARGEDGWAFLRRLWADIDTTHIPAIIVTGEADSVPMDGDVLWTLHCQVLRKPLDAAALLRTIAAALRPSPALHARGTSQPVASSRVAPDDRFLVAADG